MDKYEDIYFPLPNKKPIKVSKEEQTVTLQGLMISHNNYMITILQNESYKSFVLKSEFFTQKEDGDYMISIHIDEFTNSIIHEVEMPHDIDWMAYASIITPENEKITIASWSQGSDFQTGKILKFFTTPNIDISLLTLNIKNSKYSNGYEYNRIFEAFPDFIKEYNPDFELDNIWKDAYNIQFNGKGNLFVAEYKFNEKGYICSWKIYQKLEEKIKHFLSPLPSKFLENAPITRERINNPISFQGKFYQIDDSDLDEIYNLRNINKLLHCMDYSNKFLSIKL